MSKYKFWSKTLIKNDKNGVNILVGGHDEIHLHVGTTPLQLNDYKQNNDKQSHNLNKSSKAVN